MIPAEADYAETLAGSCFTEAAREELVWFLPLIFPQFGILRLQKSSREESRRVSGESGDTVRRRL